MNTQGEISILEVGPRDGLQNEPVFLSLEDKFQLVKKLSFTGLSRIELGAFVSPKWTPQMRDTRELVKQVLKSQEKSKIPKKVKFSALVPNMKGLHRALETGLKEVSIFLSATETFSKKNINCSLKDGYTRYKKLCKQAFAENLKVRAYLSVCFFCPYEGKVLSSTVLEWSKKIEDLGVYEIALSDTTGKARPIEVQNLLELLLKTVPKTKLAFHFHNMQGMALANVWSAYQMGIRSFDGSLGGLGGCPHSEMSSGNVATESLFYLLKSSQDPIIHKIISVALWLEKKLRKKLPSPLLQSSSNL